MIDNVTKLIAALVVSVSLTACSPVYRHHGYVPPEDVLSLVQVGQTSRDDLPELIGKPSAEGVLTGAGWYYVGSRWKFYGPLEPQEVERQVVAISFYDNGTVSNVERFGLQDGHVVTLSRRVTDANVAGVGFIRQIMGNLGRVDASQFFR
ncbi:MAG: outer membrane protein assembly factor BamE [Paracoccus sp. (in: a-proteobacteria)]|uniref:outer membrane protein assembly factor BamE n=1 Tax=Paracoccus sp. TaxID=267 RepID=UPI0026E02D5B|nr:outer membrane protein assembly factor BamE [Paracoccus sp. (in: a-proteobacteria)]MDO5620638.1 outer membrane protein assembly factor BamE [Paracoccus sp. (in: a-proteobacteria)]